MMEGWQLCDRARTTGRRSLAVIAASCFIAANSGAAGNPASPAQLGAARHTAAQFEDLAGSPRNAWALVQGLRWGIAITLAGPRPSSPRISFTPPGRPMGYGNVTKALTIARKEFIARGIAEPTPEQLEILLLGGPLRAGWGASARVIHTPGILALRSVHLGWGQIAHAVAISPTSRPAARRYALR